MDYRQAPDRLNEKTPDELVRFQQIRRRHHGRVPADLLDLIVAAREAKLNEQADQLLKAQDHLIAKHKQFDMLVEDAVARRVESLKGEKRKWWKR